MPRGKHNRKLNRPSNNLSAPKCLLKPSPPQEDQTELRSSQDMLAFGSTEPPSMDETFEAYCQRVMREQKERGERRKRPTKQQYYTDIIASNCNPSPPSPKSIAKCLSCSGHHPDCDSCIAGVSDDDEFLDRLEARMLLDIAEDVVKDGKRK